MYFTKRQANELKKMLTNRPVLKSKIRPGDCPLKSGDALPIAKFIEVEDPQLAKQIAESVLPDRDDT